MKITVRALAEASKGSMIQSRNAAQVLGRAENWCKRLVAENFGSEIADAACKMPQAELEALCVAASSFFTSLFTQDDKDREEACRRANAADQLDAGDIDAESMNQGEVILNLTPHAVVVVDDSGNKVAEFAPEAVPARLATRTEKTGAFIAGIPVTKTVFGDPVGLPEQRPNVFLIVSALFKSALPGRTDLLIPNETVRDSAGKIIGCKSFA